MRLRILPLLPIFAIGLPAQDNPSEGRESYRVGTADREFLARTDSTGEIPYLYDGEIEDIGPQFLLLPGKEKFRWFRTLLDSQWFYNSNPTLAEKDDSVGTDVWITTLEARTTTPAYEALDGLIELSVGLWAQTYLYGTLSGPDKEVGGIEMSDNDFTGITLFGEVGYENGPWIAGLGLRWTRLSNTGGDDGFYREWVPSWEAGYRLPLGRADLIGLRYNGSWHSTENETFQLFRDDLNDRWSHTLSLVWTRLLAPGWYLQPYGAIIYETYENEDHREDWTWIGGAALIRQFNETFSARLFVSYQKRNSNQTGIADYEQWNSGMGGSIAFRF